MRCMALVAGMLLCPTLVFAAAPTRVTIDQHNRLLLNGKPWFPLCLSGGPPLRSKDPLGRDGMDTVKASGINSFRVGGAATNTDRVEIPAEYIDWIGEHGMYAIIHLRELSVFDPNIPARREQLRAAVEQYRHHPALALWKVKDEPAWPKNVVPPEQMIPAYKFLKQLDPDHPALLNHAAWGDIKTWRTYADACDVSGLDIYPISVPKGKGSHIPNKELSCVGDYTGMISEAMNGRKPILMVLQVCWSGAMPPKNVRIHPTCRQERYMAYQAIIKGARGLFFFGSDKGYEEQDAPYGFNWTFWNAVLGPLLSEIGEGRELHSALLAPNSKLALKVSGAPDIEFTAREVGPFAYIMAAKREGAEGDVRFSGARLKGEIEVMFENRTVDAAKGVFTDFFKPNDVHVYKVRLRS